MAVLTLRRQKTTSLMLSLSITLHQVPHQSTSEVFDPLPSLRGDEIHVVYIQFRIVEQLGRYSASYHYNTKRSTKLPSLSRTRDVIKLRVEWRHPTTGENFIKIVILSNVDNLRQQSCIYHPQLCSFMPDKQQRTHDMSSPICSQLSPYE